MKRTLMLTMLAAALTGGQVFADVTGTAVDNCEKTENGYYYGKYSDSESVSGGNVTIKNETTGQVPNDAQVIGGRAEAGEASNNMVTMQGGTVRAIYGGNGSTGASNNTVTMQDGTVQTITGGWGSTGASNNKVTMQGGTVSGTIYGGNGGTEGDSYNNTVIMTGGSVTTINGGASGNNYTASDNVVIVTGGSINTFLIAGIAGAAATNNKMHLVGKGASNVNIADAQSNIGTYDGSNGGISLSNVIGGRATKTSISTGNSIDIYGTGIEISGMFAYMQVLTFNITNDAVTALAPAVAVTLTSQSSGMALNLTGVDLQVKDLDVKDWATGKTITLVQSEQEIKGAADELTVGKEVEIKRGEVVTATATLKLGDDKKSLILTNIQGKNVPEPATSSLSLLALAGLCVRRRRK